jgi:hypothetical protein
VDHYAAGFAMASLVEGFAVAEFADDIVARSSGVSELAEFDSVLPNIHHQLEDQTVDSDKLHVKPSSLAHLFEFVLLSNQRLLLLLLLRHLPLSVIPMLVTLSSLFLGLKLTGLAG